MKKITVFITSDSHGKFDELMNYIEKKGFNINNSENILILNGDILSKELPKEENERTVEKIQNLICKYNNIFYILGNHEIDIIERKKINNEYLEFLKKQYIAFDSKDLFICHGWYNPRWKLKTHLNKKENDNRSGELVSGSPSYIYNKQPHNKTYWGYESLEQYVFELNKRFPGKKFVFGHAPNFLWNYKPLMGITYSKIKEEFTKFKDKDSIFQKMIKEYDYSKCFIDNTKTLYCSDVFTKIHFFNEKYYFSCLKFEINDNYTLYDLEYHKVFIK